MKVVLATPADTIRQRFSLINNTKVGHFMPLGLCYIAAVLRETGCNVLIIDAPPLNLSLTGLTDKILKTSPDIIGISTTSSTINQALLLAEQLKKKENIPIVFGGPHPTMMYRELLQSYGFIDIVVIGEGESSMLKIVQSYNKLLKKFMCLDNIPGIAFVYRNNIVVTMQAVPLNLEYLPFPARDLLYSELYLPMPHRYKRLPTVSMITSRGCPYSQCVFCTENRDFKSIYRRQSPYQVIYEIKFLIDNYKVKEIYFWDDIFTFDSKWVLQFCHIIKEEEIDITWSCFGSINTVDKEMLKTMAEAGCWSIFYGIESGNQMILDMINKNLSIDEIFKKVKWSKEAGLEVTGSFILGLPGETPHLARESIKLAIDLDLDFAHFFYATPYPGSLFFQICKSKGKLKDDFSKFTGWNPVFIPDSYPSEKVLTITRLTAFLKFYFRPRFILKFIKRKYRFKKLFLSLKLLIELIFKIVFR